MEVTLAHPGLQFYAEPMAGFDHGQSATVPKRNELYVVCLDGSVQSVWDPEQPVKWLLMESGDQWFYRETRTGAEPKPCFVRYHATSEDPPAGRGEPSPQNAEIIEQDDADLEVSSPCPWAPKKPDLFAEAKNLDTIARNLNPQLAACAAIVGDPVQTEAMAKFADGKLSYFEMRSLCG